MYRPLCGTLWGRSVPETQWKTKHTNKNEGRKETSPWQVSWKLPHVKPENVYCLVTDSQKTRPQQTRKVQLIPVSSQGLNSCCESILLLMHLLTVNKHWRLLNTAEEPIPPPTHLLTLSSSQASFILFYFEIIRSGTAWKIGLGFMLRRNHTITQNVLRWWISDLFIVFFSAKCRSCSVGSERCLQCSSETLEGKIASYLLIIKV